jgi:hypothetical protein
MVKENLKKKYFHFFLKERCRISFESKTMVYYIGDEVLELKNEEESILNDIICKDIPNCC